MDWIKNVLLSIFSFVIAIALIELGIVIFNPELFKKNQPSFQTKLYQFDERLGWVNSPNTTETYRRKEFSYEVSINSSGMRDAEIANDDSRINIAVIGDSFVWGIGAKYGERFTEIIEQNVPSINILNFGVSGYGTLQEYLQLDDVFKQNVDYVILTVCLANDLLDNTETYRYHYAHPYAALRPETGGFELKGYPIHNVKKFGEKIDNNKYFPMQGINLVIKDIKTKIDSFIDKIEGGYSLSYELLYTNPEKLDVKSREYRNKAFLVFNEILRAMRNKVEMNIGPDRFLVVLAPTKFEVGLSSRQAADPNTVGDEIVKIIEHLSIPYIDGRTVIAKQDFWQHDSHWRPSGHIKISNLIQQHIQNWIMDNH